MSLEKILWVVNYDSLDEFAERASACKVTGVAIRTDNNLLKAIQKFHALGVKVFGWRWPSAMQDPAMKEAAKVVDLLGHGLDGYYVDPEGQKGKPWDWDQSGLAQLADDFCRAIKTAAPDKPLGTTSHYRANKVFPKLPWATFFKYSDVLLPQAYWRSTEGTIGHGLPGDNYRASQTFWSNAGGSKDRIVPMAGELGVSTAAEVKEYVEEAKAQDRPMHFYAFEGTVKPSVWGAVAEA